MKNLKLPLVGIVLLWLTSIHAQLNNPDDYIALRALYLSTDGDNWDDSGWPDAATFSANPTIPPGTDMSTWYGIIGSGGRVTTVQLRNNSLNGAIPTEIEKLSNLKTLFLSENQISGTIPIEIANLSNLESLNLYDNQIEGTIPPALGGLTNLRSLILADNLISGIIPPELGNLSFLYILVLRGNELSGTIPPELGGLSQLEVLELQLNSLSGQIPSELGNLSELTNFLLSNNNLTGCYDSNLSNLCDHVTFHSIEIGNTLDASWEDFCADRSGECGAASPQADHPDDYTALRALYLSTNGDAWTDNTGWPDAATFTANPTPPAGTDMSTWYGITVNEDDRVIEILIDENQLTGSIPAEMGNLSNLTQLYLFDNQLTGPIPTELGNLSNLTSLSLNDNQLSGPIPTELGNLASLQQLYLWNNQLSGPIPPEMGNLSSLSYLVLDNNQLSGTIPAELGNLANLTLLHLRDNELSGCFDSNLSNLCTQLTSWNITGGNSFDASWEDFCADGSGQCGAASPQANHSDDYTALRALYLSTDGDAWTDNSGWPDAATFTANPTPPAGTDISTWFGITVNADKRVSAVFLQQNNLNGSLPNEIGLLTELINIGMWKNFIDGPIPTELGSLNHLELIDLSINELFGSIPSELGDLANLTLISLEDNKLTGSIPSELGKLSNLKSLYLHYNQLSGSIPAELGNIASLTQLNFFGNQLSGNIPAELGNLASLTQLHLGRNQLSGTIPAELGNLASLTQLNLGNNQLSGTIPAELGNLASLTLLYLFNNQLSGTIPTELGNLASLTLLGLFGNQLSGTIPTELGNLASLTYLHLDSNQLSGTIPAELGNLASLRELHLSNNQLSGTIPAELGNLASLTLLFVNANDLSGCFDSNLSNLCDQLLGYSINLGNSFDSTWEGFCTDGSGQCDALLSSCAELIVEVDYSDVTCWGGSDGFVSLDKSSLPLDATIVWDDGNTEWTRTDLTAGTWTATISSPSLACTEDNLTFEIGQPETPGFTIDFGDETPCAPGGGTLTILLEEPELYTISWLGPEEGGTIPLPDPGSYGMTISPKDDCGLSLAVTFIVPEEEEVKIPTYSSIKVKDVSCPGKSDGGFRIYKGHLPSSAKITWEDGNQDWERSGLSSGEYLGVITSPDHPCINDSVYVTINEPVELTYSIKTEDIIPCDTGGIVISVDLNLPDDYDIIWNDEHKGKTIQDPSVSEFELEFKSKKGCPSHFDTYTFEEVDPVLAELNFNGGHCYDEPYTDISLSVKGGIEPYDVYWSDGHTGMSHPDVTLEEKNLLAYITDGGGCLQVVRLQKPKVPMGLSLRRHHATDGNNGSIWVDVRGAQPISYLWDDGSTEVRRSDLSAGVYILTATDANGCVRIWNIPIYGDETTLSRGQNPIEKSKSIGHKLNLNPDLDHEVFGLALEADLDIFPNPSTDWINVQYSGDESVRKVTLYNILGQDVYTQEEIDNNSIQISVQDFNPGIYQLEVLIGDKSYQSKISVQ